MDTAFLYLVLWAAVFAVVFAVLIKKGWFFGGGGKLKTGARGALDRNFIAQKWQEIEQLVSTGKPSGYKTAIIEADKLVDYVLKAKVGVDGNMGERLKRSQKLFSNYSEYQDLWSAHKVRNRIAHETDHDFFASEAQKTILQFEKALKELNAL